MKQERDAYIMLKGILTPETPVILHLNSRSSYHPHDPSYTSLTYRQLHQQLRDHMSRTVPEFGPHVSLRVCKWKPWYGYGFPVPEHEALPAHDQSCTELFGTTLVVYAYVSMSCRICSQNTCCCTARCLAARQDVPADEAIWRHMARK